MNRRKELGGVRVERQRYKRWGYNIQLVNWRSRHPTTHCSQQGRLGEVYSRAGGALGVKEERWSWATIFTESAHCTGPIQS